MLEFLGRLHPVLVHLPIGILLLTVLFEWLSAGRRFETLRPALPLMFQLGAAAAVFSCASGWVLASGGDYAGDAVGWHRWLGVGTAVTALGACFLKKRRLVAGLIAVLVAATGHLGGSLTHGAGYLTAPFNADTAAPTPPPADVQQAKLYVDLIAPILKEKCSACHGSGKQKGGLRLDTPEYIQKGGKNGPVIAAGSLEQSELIRRLLLRPEDEDHMPPKEKNQPTALEIELLRWWIGAGADFHKTVAALPQSAQVKAMLVSWQTGDKNTGLPYIPPGDVDPAPPEAVAALQKAGVAVLPLGRHNNYLSLNFINLANPADSVFSALVLLQRQITWLKLSGCSLSDTAWQQVGRLTNLTKLYVDHTNISDAQLACFKPLNRLQYLNLTHTGLSAAGIMSLKDMPALQHIYAYKTAVKPGEWPGLARNFPKTRLDSGGYQIPGLVRDTASQKISDR